jgi:drug/metabolite transporter (DMT)-like permease
VFTVFNKKVVDRFPARTVAGYEIGFGFLFLCCVAPFFLGANPGIKLTPTPSDWLWLGILSLACTVWAQSLSLSALKKVSSFTVTLSVNLEPVYGILLACIVFAENKQLNMGFYLGMALIIASVLLHIAFMSRKSKRDAEAELLNTP